MADVVGRDDGWQTVIAGDVCYEREMSAKVPFAIAAGSPMRSVSARPNSFRRLAAGVSRTRSRSTPAR